MSTSDISPSMINLFLESKELSTPESIVDPISKSFYSALTFSLFDPQIRNAFYDSFQGRKKLTTRDNMSRSYACNYAYRYVHNRMLNKYVGYSDMTAEELSAQDFWSDAIAEATRDVNDMKSSFIIHETHSNKPERYKSIPMVKNLYSERFEGPTKILDIGSSAGLGLKHLALRRPFEEVHSTVTNHENIVNNDLLRPSKQEDVYVGFDLHMQKEGDAKLSSRARSDSIPPHEMVKPGNLAAYDELDAQQPSNVELSMNNIALDPESFKRYAAMDGHEAKSFDVVVLSTVLYQIRDNFMNNVLENIENMLNPDGAQLVIVNEHAQLDPSLRGISAINILKNGWYVPEDMPYRTFVVDYKNGGEATEIARWSSGRCKEVVLSSSTLKKLSI